MSQWHRNNPELAGTDADPWMAHDSYRRAFHGPAEDRIVPDRDAPDVCPDCGEPITLQPSGWWFHDGLPNGCWRASLDGPTPTSSKEGSDGPH